MSISTHALLTPEERSRLAAMPELGGGNLLATAMAVHPDPHIPFIRTGRPVINTAGEEQTEFTLAQLDVLVQSWSVWYHEQGVGPRDRVALYMEDTFAYTIHLNALAQLGAIGVLINSKASQALALGLCERTTPVGWFPAGDGNWLVVASANGAADNPAWYYNLAANPDKARIEVRGETVPVTAEQLHGSERQQAWEDIVKAAPSFAKYVDKTDRTIPIIKLTRQQSAV